MIREVRSCRTRLHGRTTLAMYPSAVPYRCKGAFVIHIYGGHWMPFAVPEPKSSKSQAASPAPRTPEFILLGCANITPMGWSKRLFPMQCTMSNAPIGNYEAHVPVGSPSQDR